MKIIFYDTKQFISHQNIHFKINKPKKQQSVLQNSLPFESYMNGYYTILKDDNKIKMIYRGSKAINGHDLNLMHSKCNCWDHSTCIVESNDGINFNKPQIILKGKCASHNFCPIISPSNEYFGIGGLHSNIKYHTKCHSIKNIKYKGKELRTPYEYHPCHCNGLYLFKSKDLLNWSLVKKNPIISGIHPGHTDNRWGWSEYDAKISCFYSKILGKYVIYVRSNVATRIRWVQMATSVDLINWSPFKLLNVIPKFNIKKDNYYHMDVMEYPGTNLFIGLSPYTDRTDNNSFIALLLSTDGINWIRYGSILDTPLCKLKKRNAIHNTSIFLENGNNFDFYFHENYSNFQNKNYAEIVKYNIKKDRIFELYSEKGNFKIELELKNKLFINFKTKKDGHIKIKINDKEYELRGNELDKEIETELGCVIIECEIFKSSLYSFII